MKGEDLNDERLLVERCLEGDQRALRDFVERFQGLLYGVCLRILGDRHEAEDAAQESFVRALRHLDRWDSQRTLRPWLLTIAANRCRSRLRQRGHRPAECPYPDEIPDRPPSITEEGNELEREIKVAIAKLRPEYQQVFLLFHEQGMRYEEMSQLTGSPVGTLKTWLHRARQQVLDELRKKGLVAETENGVSAL